MESKTVTYKSVFTDFFYLEAKNSKHTTSQEVSSKKLIKKVDYLNDRNAMR